MSERLSAQERARRKRMVGGLGHGAKWAIGIGAFLLVSAIAGVVAWTVIGISAVGQSPWSGAGATQTEAKTPAGEEGAPDQKNHLRGKDGHVRQD